MKVFIGDYTNYFGTHHLAKMLCFWVPKVELDGKKEFPEWVDKFGDWLENTWVYDLLVWIDDKKERKIKVKVDKYDIWSAEHTLALVILPVLKEFRKAEKYGVPCGLDIAYIPLDDAEEDKQMLIWNELLDKMIWSFEQIINDDDDFWIQKPNFDDCETGSEFVDRISNGSGGKYDHEARKKYDEKIQEGLDLFAKHFRNLWD